VAEEWEKWVPVCDRLLYQCFYRVLSFISVHTSVSNVYKSLERLAEKRGGRLYWVWKDRVARWDDLEVFPGIKMSIWIFGGPRNTVYARRGWWAMYLFDPYVKSMARVFGTLRE